MAAFTSCTNNYVRFHNSRNIDFVEPDCDAFLNKVYKNWYKKKGSPLLYKSKNKLAEKLRTEFIGCLQTLDGEQIKQLFGNPSRRTNLILLYYIDSKCEGGMPSNGCQALVFVLDTESRKVNTVYTEKLFVIE